MINLQNVSFSYNYEKVLSNISFHIGKGEFTAIIGSNGAGKSTLCRIMNGLIKPSSGTVTVNGMDTRTTKSSILARHIGFLFQNPDRQICKNTVGEEIRFSLNNVITDKSLIEKRLFETLSLFDFDADSRWLLLPPLPQNLKSLFWTNLPQDWIMWNV
jgi:energy-coupling factor transport system ATP-binding protein